jgi:hypothetical protein
MSIDLWHHYLLLRPLLVFVLAAPLLVLALIFRGRGRSRGSESKAHDDPARIASSAMNEGHPEQGSERRVEAGPGEWRVGTVASDRRAA